MDKSVNNDQKPCVICKKIKPKYDLNQFVREIYIKFAAVLKVRQQWELKYADCKIEDPKESFYHVGCLALFRKLSRNHSNKPKDYLKAVEEEWPEDVSSETEEPKCSQENNENIQNINETDDHMEVRLDNDEEYHTEGLKDTACHDDSYETIPR